MIVQVGVYKCHGQCLRKNSFPRVAQHAFVKSVGMSAVDIRYWIFVLVMAPCFCRRCSRSWLLWRKCKLHFSHCKRQKSGITFRCSRCVLDLFWTSPGVNGVSLHGRASLPCVCAGGSSTSADGGSVFHRSHRGMASHPCGSTRGHEDEQPKQENPAEFRHFWANYN